MKVNELKNPLIEHKIAILRNKETGTKEFRELVSEIAMFLCYEAMQDAKLEMKKIETPIKETTVKMQVKIRAVFFHKLYNKIYYKSTLTQNLHKQIKDRATSSIFYLFSIKIILLELQNLQNHMQDFQPMYP